MLRIEVVENIKTHILCSKTFTRKSCRLWNDVGKYYTAKQAKGDNIMRRMSIACWITKATKKHAEYIVHIAFPPQKELRERNSMLRYLPPFYGLNVIICRLFVLIST